MPTLFHKTKRMLQFFGSCTIKPFITVKVFFSKKTVVIRTFISFTFLFFCTNNFGQGNAMNFNGINNHIGLSLNGFSNGMDHTTYTVQAWVRAIKKQSATIFWSTSFELQLKDDSICATIEGYNGIYRLSSFFDYIPGQWYHISFSLVNGTVCYLYANGILVGTQNMPATGAALARYNTLWIGYNDDKKDKYISGDIDEVKIWSTDRTSHISADMLEDKGPFGPELFSYLKFDEGLAGGDNRSINHLVDFAQYPANNPPQLTGFEKIGNTGNWVKSYAMLLPIGLAASNIKSTSFIANWSQPVNLVADSYLVDITDELGNFRPLRADVIKKGYITLSAIDTFLLIPDLKPNTDYHFRVRAVKGSDENKIISACSETMGTTTSR